MRVLTRDLLILDSCFLTLTLPYPKPILLPYDHNHPLRA